MTTKAIAKREIRAMIAEKSFILIFLLEFLLVSSSGLLSVGYVMFTSPEHSSALDGMSGLIHVGVVSESRDIFIRELSKNSINHIFYGGAEQALSDFRNGLTDAVIVGDIGLGSDPSTLTVYLPENSPKAPLTSLALRKAFLGMESSLRRIKADIYAVDVSHFEYRIINNTPAASHIEIYYLFTLPLLLFIPALISGSLVIDSITQDIESKRILNLILAPMNPFQIVSGKISSSFILSFFQSIVWLAILSATLIRAENTIWLIVFCALYSAIFANLGALIALGLKKNKPSQIIYTAASMACISLFSPFANVHPDLLAQSPAFIIARLATGSDISGFAGQLFALVLLALFSFFAVFSVSRRISDP